jgi:hypothetical protein
LSTTCRVDLIFPFNPLFCFRHHSRVNDHISRRNFIWLARIAYESRRVVCFA